MSNSLIGAIQSYVRLQKARCLVRIVVVGRVGGHRRVRWGALALVGTVLGLFGAAVACGSYFALAGTVSPVATAVGLLGALLAVGSSAYRACRVPVEFLPSLDGAEPGAAPDPARKAGGGR